MIRSLSGAIIEKNQTSIVLSCGGIGFFVHVADSARFPALGEDAAIWTHFRLREDAADLFGFLTREELEVFESLQKIRGFPARAGMAVLSHCGIEGFRRAVLDGDLKTLTAVPGIGKKLAQQVLLDMRGSISLDEESRSVAPAVSSDDAVLAMIELGFAPADARERVKKARDEHGKLPANEIVKLALR